jgi:hypothetical protein
MKTMNSREPFDDAEEADVPDEEHAPATTARAITSGKGRPHAAKRRTRGSGVVAAIGLAATIRSCVAVKESRRDGLTSERAFVYGVATSSCAPRREPHHADPLVAGT